MKNNKLIVISENSFVKKIKNFFHKLKIKIFGYNEGKELEDKNQEYINNVMKNENRNEFMEELKTPYTYNNIVEKNNFLEEIKGNVDTLNLLSIDRLIKLSKYYDEIIEKNNIIIEKLKKST